MCPVWVLVVSTGCSFSSLSLGLSDSRKCHEIFAARVAVWLHPYCLVNIQDNSYPLDQEYKRVACGSHAARRSFPAFLIPDIKCVPVQCRRIIF